MFETRRQFHHELDELETRTLEGLGLVVGQLDRALESVRRQDVELAELVIADDDRIDGRCLQVHQGVLSLLARQAPVAGDLRRMAALLHVIRCIEPASRRQMTQRTARRANAGTAATTKLNSTGALGLKRNAVWVVKSV